MSDRMRNAELASNPLRVAVLGPGGVGGLLAAVLARAGHDVVCLARESTADVLRTKGIRVRSGQFGEFTAEVDADTRLREPVDLCLIAAKQTALEDSLDRLDPEILGDGLIVPLLNGVDHPKLLRERYRPELVAAGVIRVESTRLEAGLIEHTSPFADIDIASSTAPRARLDAIAEVLSAAGFGARVLDDEATTLWRKMGFLVPMALLTTRYGQTVGEIRAQHWQELRAAATEVAAVARACGAEYDVQTVVELYRSFPEGTKSSMQRDAEAGRALEVDATGGAVLRHAAVLGVSVPVVSNLVLYLSTR